MDYTKNYHLPQWVDEDRIQRVDFNEAMANIENGLTSARSGRDSLYDSLRRTAYNSWQHMAAMPESPWQDGAFHQGFRPSGSRAYKAQDGTGTIQIPPEGRWFANADKASTSADLTATVKQLSAISYATKSRKFAMTFTTTYPTVIDRVYAYGHYDRGELEGSSQNAKQIGGWSARFYDDITGKLLKETSSDEELFGAHSGVGYSFGMDLGMVLHRNGRYRYEVTLATDPSIPCEYNTGAGQLDLVNKPVDLFISYGVKQATTAFSGRLAVSGPSGDAIALAHYSTYGAEGSVTLNWQGRTLTPDVVRTITYKGKEAQEAEFQLEGPVPADSAMTLTARCGTGGEFILYDWGAVVI